MTSHSNPAAAESTVRVLTLLKGLSRGGAESLALMGARHRDRETFTHSLAYVDPTHFELSDDFRVEGVPVSCLGTGRIWDVRWLLRLRKALKSVDLVHCHSPVPAVAARLVVRTLRPGNRPLLVTTEHNMWDSHHRLTRMAERLTFGLDDAHLAVSEAVRRSVTSAQADSIEVVVQGIDLPVVRAAADRPGARRELGVKDHEVLIGTVANLRPQKGYPDLLEAAVAVTDVVTSARFVAIGKGPQKAQIEALHRSLGLGPRFSLLGYRSDAVRLISGFDIFCMASHHEGLPVALMEALALGIPVVVTRAGGNDELVTDGREGRLVDTGRPDQLAAALSALATDDIARARHAQLARDRGDTLSVIAAIRRHEALYLQLIRDRHG